MIRAWVSLFVLLASACIAGVPLSTPTPLPPVDLDSHVTALDGLAEQFSIPAASGVIVYGDETVYWTYGFADTRQEVPVTQNTRFPLASVSKPILSEGATLAITAKLVERDLTLHALLPEFDLGPAADVTLAQAVGQTSGLVRNDMAWIGRDLSLEDLAALARQSEVIAEPGTRFTYNSVVFALAVHGGARASGPSGPESVTFAFDVDPHTLGLAGQVTPVMPVRIGAIWPAVGVVGSAADMRSFLRSVMVNAAVWNQPVMGLADDDFERACCPLGRSIGYGFGWFVEDYLGVRVFSHTGTGIGTSSLVMVVPELKLGMALMTNVDHAEGILTVARYRLLRDVLGGTSPDVLLRRELAQRDVWTQLNARLDPSPNSIRWLDAGALKWPMSPISNEQDCYVVVHGPLIGKHFGAGCQ